MVVADFVFRLQDLLMNVQISVRRMPLSLGMENVINQTCNDISSKFHDIHIIEVYLEDINGPYKGGLDKRCHLKVRGLNHFSVDVTEISRDLYSAVDRAFSRLIQIIKRKLSGRALDSAALQEYFSSFSKGAVI